MNTEQIESGEIIRCRDCGHWDCDNIEMHQHSTEHPARQAEFAECLWWSCWSTDYHTRADDYCSQATERER